MNDLKKNSFQIMDEMLRATHDNLIKKSLEGGHLIWEEEDNQNEKRRKINN